MKKRLIVILALIAICFYFTPWLFVHIAQWQKAFNQLISENLHQIQAQSHQAGFVLIGVSFLYGMLHALGPGHGKFIIASYLATQESRLKQSTTLSLSASLMQGVVAISATTLLVVILNLSSRYFKLGQLWLERGALLLLIALGLYWIWQGSRAWRKAQKPKIKSLQLLAHQEKSAVKNHRTFTQSTCSCGHQHLPNDNQLQQAQNWRTQLLVVLSIGMRPCSGAIFVLFLAYMLDLYLWGIIAVLAMSLGTGLTLAAFAAIVRYARQSAVNMTQWYGSAKWKTNSENWVKCIAGVIMIFFALSLLYGTTLSSGGAVLFGG